MIFWSSLKHWSQKTKILVVVDALMPLFGSLKADELLMHLTTQCPFVLMMFSSTNIYIYIYIFLWTIPLSFIYICLSELPSSSFIIDFRYCQHIPQVCHLPITVALLKSLGHQYCSHLLTIVAISSLHSFCQILLLVACVPFHV